MMEAPLPFGRRLLLSPTKHRFEKRAVLNPAIHQENGTLHLYYRAVDPEMISSIGYLRADYVNEDVVIRERREEPLIAPEQEFEKYGVEDPRVVSFEGRLHMFCTVFNGRDACLGYCTAEHPTGFSERRLIGPLFSREEALKMIAGNARLEAHRQWWSREDPEGLLWEKDASILPRRVGGKIVFLHRLRPDMQIAFLDSLEQLGDLSFWEDHVRHLDRHLLFQRRARWEDSHIGMGPVPIETPDGWLMIYHGATKEPVKTYRAGAALLDLEDPQRVIGRTPLPLFEPEMEWEKVGDVNNVVFPEGLAVRGRILDIYYGAADTVIGRISVRMDQLIDYLKQAGV